jgi:hypothetical protein
MQYTASSFIRTYQKLAEPVLFIDKEKKDVTGLYPAKSKQVTHPGDRLENFLIDKPLFYIRRGLNSFVFLQNGNLQAYILYGFIFICLVILMPVIIDKISALIHFFNQLYHGRLFTNHTCKFVFHGICNPHEKYCFRTQRPWNFPTNERYFPSLEKRLCN